jgi:hypothetical protein
VTPPPIESQAIQKVADDYRRRGYDVDVIPSGPGLPEFLGGYQPDIIARGADESVVVEVKVGTQTSVAERFREIAERVNRQPGWRFSVVYINPFEPDQVTEAEPAPLAELQELAREADTLLGAGQPRAAFLLFWSALEGSLRLLGRRAQLPLENLPPSALIRELYSAGEIGRDHFDTLMRLLPVRNRLVHGLHGRIDETDVKLLQGLGRALLAEAASP